MTTPAVTPVRRITILVNQSAADALERRAAAEGLTPSTLFCRAMQVYDAVMSEHPDWVQEVQP